MVKCFGRLPMAAQGGGLLVVMIRPVIVHGPNCTEREELMTLGLNWNTAVTRLSLGLVSTLALSSLANAQGVVGASWDEIVELAKEEGRVNYYSIMAPAQNDALVAAFNEVYPEIQVVTVRGAGELQGRVAAEKEAGADGADVISLADPMWFIQNSADFLTPQGPGIDAFPDGHWIEPGKSLNLSYSPLGFLIWNTSRVPDGVQDWDDLLDPQWAGRIGTREGMTATLAGFLDFLQRNKGDEYMAALGQQDLRFYNSTVPLTQAVAAGEIWIANSGNMATLHQLVEQGAPIDFAFPNPSYANQQAGAAFNYSERPNAALVFLDFAASEAGQTAMNQGQLGGSPLPSIEGGISMENFEILDPAKFTQEVRNEWQVVFEDLWRP